jgi:spore maturation protein CgeB
MTAFYDIDTPVTLAKLDAGEHEYLTPALIRRYDIYLSFTGGPILKLIESRYGSPRARALYCSVDPEKYVPLSIPKRWDMGYLGTYGADRQPALDSLLLQPAREWPQGRFAVAGPQYPDSIKWPPNVERAIHLSPREHAGFYGAQRFTLNVTREAMKKAGFSPSVRLFEAAAVGVPVISDYWPGLDDFFSIGKEILVAETTDDALRFLRDLPDPERLTIAEAARQRVLAEHTSERRAFELENYLKELDGDVSAGSSRRHRRDWKVPSGLDAGMASQRSGERAGTAACTENVGISDQSSVHEPA